MRKAIAEPRWSDLVSLRARYQRSVHLERDGGDAGWLQGYVVTPLVRSVLGRLAKGLLPEGRARAWSLTGPYGSGKSAFALFLTKLLGAGDTPETRLARKHLEEADAELATTLFGRSGLAAVKDGLLPVRATAERRPLEQILLPALDRALVSHWPKGRKPAIVDRISKAARSVEKGKLLPTREVVGLFEEAAATVADSSRPGSGLLIILDEAGKAFEFAARSREQGDIFLLQELAEAAARSGEKVLVFAALLHQAFEYYADQLSTAQRNEWAKVQGRFEDVAFQESADQTVRLITRALKTTDGIPKTWRRGYETLSRQTLDNTRLPTTVDREELRESMRGVAPLHPVTAMSLSTLFRDEFSQNERSLFAFLGSAEPHGFQAFLQLGGPNRERTSLYTLDRLYDYVQHSLGGRLYGPRAHQWALIEESLRRLPESSIELDARLVKAIGLMGLLGETSGLSASLEVLRLALTEGHDLPAKEVKAGLVRLRKASIVVYRKYKDAYQLWEGSDLNVDDLVRAAVDEIDPSTAVVSRLRELAQQRPIVARRHLLETGTFRHFEVRFADHTILDSNATQEYVKADGVIWIVLPTTASDAQSVLDRLQDETTWHFLRNQPRPMILGLPSNLETLRQVTLELTALESVRSHTPDLQNDPVARREIAGRIQEAQRALGAAVHELMGRKGGCRWFSDGDEYEPESFRGFTELVSEICDEAYDEAPAVFNELLNRQHLSSSAAKARRILVQAMAEHPEQEQLGLEGFPPEVSMYRSLLKAHGLHRKKKSAWAFAPPVRSEDTGSLSPAYRALSESVHRADTRRVRLTEYYELLRRPPYGLKDGVIPVILIALLIERDSELALYEDGRFVARLNDATVERLLRVPERFELQSVKLTTARTKVLEGLRQVFSSESSSSEAQVLPLVRDLLRFVRNLPDYSKNTRSLSENAQAIREILLRAEEPAPLLFRDLPKACGLEPFDAKRAASRDRIETLVTTLREALHELGSAYNQLLERIAGALASEFETTTETTALRGELSLRAKRLELASLDANLAGFTTQAGDGDAEIEQWLVGIGTQLGGKPPERWHDHDADAMLVNLGLIRKRFVAIESLLHAQRNGSDEDGDVSWLRIGVAAQGSAEAERVVAIRAKEQDELQAYREALHQVLKDHRAKLSADALLAGLAMEAKAELSKHADQTTQTEHEAS